MPAWWKIGAAVLGGVAASKSRPEKSDYDQLSPIQQGNIQRGRKRIERHDFFREKMHKKMVEHIESPGVKKQLEGIKAMDIAEADGVLTYEKARSTKQYVASTKAEAELVPYTAQMSESQDLGKTLMYLNALSGHESALSETSRTLGSGQMNALVAKYEGAKSRAGLGFGLAAGFAAYKSGYNVITGERVKEDTVV